MCDSDPWAPDAGDTTWLILSGSLVFIMTPGLGFFYGGMARSKHFLSTVMTSMLAIAVVSLQWFLWGYTLTFSRNGGPFLGDMSNIVLEGVGFDPHPNAACVPEVAFMFYQMMFAIITPALAFGGAAERASLSSYMVFLFVWSTLVYDFVAYWTWNQNGWLFKLGGLDFAGGGPVHLASGTAALAYAIIIGKRDLKETPRPHNISHVVLGTALLWFGWFGFNGGSELGINARAANACLVTHVAASVAGITWVILDWKFEAKGKLTTMGFCTGCVVGLVVITPASGFVTVASSIAMGFIGSCVCYAMTLLKHKWPVDDAMDVFAIHGTGGATGAILTGIFGQKYINTLDDTAPVGGWIDSKWDQIGIQIAGVLAIGSWSFVMSYIILSIMDRIPSLGLRVPTDMELIGSDETILGEVAYRHDHYVAKSRGSRLFVLEDGAAGILKALGLSPSKLNLDTSPETPRRSAEDQKRGKIETTTPLVVRNEKDLQEENIDSGDDDSVQEKDYKVEVETHQLSSKPKTTSHHISDLASPNSPNEEESPKDTPDDTPQLQNRTLLKETESRETDDVSPISPVPSTSQTLLNRHKQQNHQGGEAEPHHAKQGEQGAGGGGAGEEEEEERACTIQSAERVCAQNENCLIQ